MHFLGAVKHRQGAIDDARHFFMECLAQDAVTVRPSAAITFAILLVEDGNKVEATDWLRRGFEWAANSYSALSAPRFRIFAYSSVLPDTERARVKGQH